MMRNTNKEKIIKFIIKQYYNTPNLIVNYAKISKEDLKQLNISLAEASKIIFTLDYDNLLDIVNNSTNFCDPWTLRISSKLLDYFKTKRENIAKNIREIVRTYVIALFSLISLIVAIISLFITITK